MRIHPFRARAGDARGHAHPRAQLLWLLPASLIAAVLFGPSGEPTSGAMAMGRAGKAATPPPPIASTFRTLPPGSPLPSGADCENWIRRSAWEPRPENQVANHTTPEAVSLPAWGGVNPLANTSLKPRIDGNFTGTTDEIIQWASCKWGFNDNVTRAMATSESWWVQSAKGDYETDQARCAAGYIAPCPTSFGLLQIKHYVHRGTYPHSAESTALNVDYALGMQRVCYEGWLEYAHFPEDYRAGDRWGCVGFHYSGEWRDPAAIGYIRGVQEYYRSKPWREWEG
jgi:hypothetical protein